jgi:hypothetical protein
VTIVARICELRTDRRWKNAMNYDADAHIKDMGPKLIGINGDLTFLGSRQKLLK